MSSAADFAALGRRLIAGQENPGQPLPLKPWQDFALRFTVEYPAHRFEEEAGFWASVLGLQFLSLNGDYAICIAERAGCTFSFKRSAAPHDLSALRIQWFTDGLDDVLEALRARGAAPDIVRHSANQRYARLTTPSGLPVELWSGWEPAENDGAAP